MPSKKENGSAGTQPKLHALLYVIINTQPFVPPLNHRTVNHFPIISSFNTF